MEYIITKETAKKWIITQRMVVYHCFAGRILGPDKIENTWLIPKNEKKSANERRKEHKHE